MVDRPNRRLSAIVSADVAGYSRLMGHDERGTLAALKAHRSELIDAAIADHGGRIVKTTGDGVLVEFPSVVAAVDCCVLIQAEMGRRNIGIAESEAICFRIGVHLGDVIVDEEDIFGDGVNIAARLQEIAEPGGIAISGIVHDYLDCKQARGFVDIGERDLKNIRRPIRVWQQALNTTGTESGSLEFPEKPSIAVLPFQNRSGDPEQEYFAQGIADDIITGLSKCRWLFVIARNSSFSYAGHSIDLRQIGCELGVRYVLEGSMRRGGNRVRVNAQLVEANTARHVWADHYDGRLDDIFQLQDDITTRILRTLGSELMMAEVERSRLSRSQNINAWDLYLRALPHSFEMSKVRLEQAREYLQAATKSDPGFSSAYALLAFCHSMAAYYGWWERFHDAAKRSYSLAEMAVNLDPQNPLALACMGQVLEMTGPQERAVLHLRRALELDSNLTLAWGALGSAYGFMGRPDEALEAVDNARRGSPRDPLGWQWYLAESIAHFAANRLEPSARAAKVVIEAQPSWYGSYPLLAASAAQCGKIRVAQDAVEKLLELVPHFSVRGVARNPMFERPDDVKRMIDGLRLAGLPE